MRAIGKLGGERTKQLAASRPGYYALIGAEGGRVSSKAQRTRFAPESPSAASDESATTRGPQTIAGPVTPVAAQFTVRDILGELEATIQQLKRGS
jgi:hypothetical protein